MIKYTKFLLILITIIFNNGYLFADTYLDYIKLNSGIIFSKFQTNDDLKKELNHLNGINLSIEFIKNLNVNFHYQFGLSFSQQGSSYKTQRIGLSPIEINSQINYLNFNISPAFNIHLNQNSTLTLSSCFSFGFVIFALENHKFLDENTDFINSDKYYTFGYDENQIYPYDCNINANLEYIYDSYSVNIIYSFGLLDNDNRKEIKTTNNYFGIGVGIYFDLKEN